MTIVVEDGTILNGSPRPNSFVTVAEFQAFWTQRHDTTPADADGEANEAALVYAWDYLNQEFRLRFKGSLVHQYQAGTWPRSGVPVPDFFDPYFRNVNVPFEFRHTYFIAPNEIPVEVKEAQMLLAKASLDSTTAASSLENQLDRVTKREKLGDLEVEYAVSDEGAGAGARQTTLYWDAQKRLEPYLKPTSGGTMLRS
jgi:hypothetical protein